MNRTYHPKMAHYGGDGSGRDFYILHTNGGLQPPTTKVPVHTKSATRIKTSMHSIEPTAFKYISDGSGRDYYITHNSGGLQPAYSPGGKKDPFISSLRNDMPRPSATTTDFYRSWVPNRSRYIMNKQRKQVLEVTSRLFTGSPRCSLSPEPPKNTKSSSVLPLNRRYNSMVDFKIRPTECKTRDGDLMASERTLRKKLNL